MQTIELQAEYQSLVLTPTARNKITRADLVIDPRIAAMTKGIKTPGTFDYKEEYYKDYMNL